MRAGLFCFSLRDRTHSNSTYTRMKQNLIRLLLLAVLSATVCPKERMNALEARGILPGTSLAFASAFNQGTAGANNARDTETVNAAQYPNLSAAITALGETERTLLISTAQSVKASLAVPANITLQFTRGGRIDVAAGQILTVNHTPLASATQQLFGGAGRVVFSRAVEVYPHWFGAQGDWNEATGTDDTAAIQSAINSLPAFGGKILFPSGYKFRCASPLALDRKAGIHLVGTGGGQQTSANTLVYTGAGDVSSSFISMKSSVGLKFINMDIVATNPAFLGVVVNGDRAAGLPEPGLQLFLMDFSSVSGPVNAKALLRLNETISSKITNSKFSGGQIGILGRDGGYSNMITLDNNFFIFQGTASIKNAGEAWAVKHNTFEPLRDGRIGVYTQNLTPNDFALGFNFKNNWVGDPRTAGGTAIEVKAVGGEISGNFFYSENVASTFIKLHNSEGFSITGNEFFANSSTAIDVASTSYGLSITGNNIRTFRSVTNAPNAVDLALLGNHDLTGSLIPNALTGATRIGQMGRSIEFATMYSVPGGRLEPRIGFLDSAAVFAYGSIGIMPTSDATFAPFAETVFFHGMTPTVKARINSNGLQILGGLTATTGAGQQEVARFSNPAGLSFITVGNGLTSNAGAYLSFDSSTARASFGPHGTSGISVDSGNNLNVPAAISVGGGTAVTKIISGTGSLDFTALAARSCEVVNITVTGAADGDVVSLGIPNALANAEGATQHTTFTGWVSASNIVSVRRCNLTAATTVDPARATVRAQVTKF